MPSYTTGTPAFSVSAITRSETFSRAVTMTWVQPALRAISALASELTVPITIAPRWLAH